jgi:hypothetical protein
MLVSQNVRDMVSHVTEYHWLFWYLGTTIFAILGWWWGSVKFPLLVGT